MSPETARERPEGATGAPIPASVAQDAKSGPEPAAKVGPVWPLSEADLLATPRLRLKSLEEGSRVAMSRQKRRARDFLCYWGVGQLGIYYERETVRGARAAAEGYARGLRVVKHLAGDLDGILVYEPGGPEDIPRCFFRDPARGPGKSAEYLAAIRPGRAP